MQEKSSYHQTSPNKQQLDRNAFNISVITALLLGLALGVAYLLSPTSLDTISLVGLLAGIFSAGTSIWLSRRQKSEIGIGILITALIAISVSQVFVRKGQALATSITNIIIISGISFYTLRRKWAGWAIMASFLMASVTVVIDQFTTGVPESSRPEAATAIAVGLSLIYLVIIALQFKNFPLRVKLIFGFLVLTTLPLLILGWQTNLATREILREEIKSSILESTLSISDVFQEFVDSQHVAIGKQARTPELTDFLSLPAPERADSDLEAAALETLTKFKDESASHIIAYSLVDLGGRNILSTDPSAIGVSYTDQAFIASAITDHKPHASGLYLTHQPDVRIIYFATPIVSKTNDSLGVLLVTYNAKILQAVMDTILRGRPVINTDQYSFLIDKTGFFVLAHSSFLTLDFKTYLGENDPRLKVLQEQAGTDLDAIKAFNIPQPEIVEAIKSVPEGTSSFQIPSVENDGKLAESAANTISSSDWVLVTSQPVSTISKATSGQTRNTVLISIAIVFIAAVSAVAVSNVFTNPLQQLTSVAEKISAGDFSQQAEIKTHDEIGLLAGAINEMASQIRGFIASLENRVEQRTLELAQRTNELEKLTEQSKKRADELQIIAEISGYISAEKDLESLLPLITKTVSERFGFYHVGIFLLNENGKFAVLRAANSPGGQVMLKRQHKLEVGQVGIVGNVTATGIARIALDTGADSTFFNNPDLPETHSEMALPLIARGTIIGALDVQSTFPNAFTQNDISILGLLADQIAIAIDNVRLLDETKKALAEAQSSFREYLAGAWQNKSASEIFGYYQTLTGGQLITGEKTPEVVAKTEKDENALSIPIQLRDQVIGTVHIRPNKEDRAWSRDEINIVNAVAERLGLALDNARLFEETSSRASRERLVTEITTKIRGTNDPQEMIRTAVQELQRALGASRVEIVPRKNAPPPDK
ncbi:MAG TPA: GAF domain-containing protein [Anaerolineales bacterium]|nr:GAF domain-containing protein [Anaerolineales bacterium]